MNRPYGRNRRGADFYEIIESDRGLKIILKKKTGKEGPASKFLICHRRKNRPQVSPQVCEKRCRHRYRCPSFFEYLQPPLFAETETTTVESLRRQRKGRKTAAEAEKPAELLPVSAPRRLL